MEMSFFIWFFLFNDPILPIFAWLVEWGKEKVAINSATSLCKNVPTTSIAGSLLKPSRLTYAMFNCCFAELGTEVKARSRTRNSTASSSARKILHRRTFILSCNYNSGFSWGTRSPFWWITFWQKNKIRSVELPDSDFVFFFCLSNGKRSTREWWRFGDCFKFGLLRSVIILIWLKGKRKWRTRRIWEIILLLFELLSQIV